MSQPCLLHSQLVHVAWEINLCLLSKEEHALHSRERALCGVGSAIDVQHPDQVHHLPEQSELTLFSEAANI